MRSRIGDWNKVMKLASTGSSSDHILKTAYLNVGDYYFDRQMWHKARILKSALYSACT